MTWKIDNSMGRPGVRVLDDNGDTVADDEPYYPARLSVAHAATIVAAVNEVAELRKHLATARAALAKIEKWHGEFPPTGRAWDDSKPLTPDNEMSYGACNGSNGERDYMRAVARAALP